MQWFYTSNPLWWLLMGSRLIIYSCIIAFYIIVCLYFIGRELAKWYKNEPWLFSVKSKGNPELKRNYQDSLTKVNPELKRNYQDSLIWVTTASHPLAAPLKSKMTCLKGPKMDQLPNLFNTPKSVGTLEELLIIP
jgi:hypothetical protein